MGAALVPKWTSSICKKCYRFRANLQFQPNVIGPKPATTACPGGRLPPWAPARPPAQITYCTMKVCDFPYTQPSLHWTRWLSPRIDYSTMNVHGFQESSLQHNENQRCSRTVACITMKTTISCDAPQGPLAAPPAAQSVYSIRCRAITKDPFKKLSRGLSSHSLLLNPAPSDCLQL